MRKPKFMRKGRNAYREKFFAPYLIAAPRVAAEIGANNLCRLLFRPSRGCHFENQTTARFHPNIESTLHVITIVLVAANHPFVGSGCFEEASPKNYIN